MLLPGLHLFKHGFCPAFVYLVVVVIIGVVPEAGGIGFIHIPEAVAELVLIECELAAGVAAFSGVFFGVVGKHKLVFAKTGIRGFLRLFLGGRLSRPAFSDTVFQGVEHLHAAAATYLAPGYAELFVGYPETGFALGALGLQAALGHASVLKAGSLGHCILVSTSQAV